MVNNMIFENTVPATNQTNEKFKIVDGGPNAKRVLFLGNSITLHERAPHIHWNGNWGMAASAEEKDYVHLVAEGLKARYGALSLCVVNASDWEWSIREEKELPFYEGAMAFDPDILIVRIGENINKKTEEQAVEEGFKRFVKRFSEHAEKTIVTSLVWSYDPIDRPIKAAAEEMHATYVDIRPIGALDENKALGKFEHPGVAGHPGDLGMRRIADAILNAIKGE